MLPSIENKLQSSDQFAELVLSAMTRSMKVLSDELTSAQGVTNNAEYLLMNWIRDKSMKGSIQDHSSKRLVAGSTFVAAILSMFNDEYDDDIVSTEVAGQLDINFDESKIIVMEKISENNYLYMLSGATPIDFQKTHYNSETSKWEIPE